MKRYVPALLLLAAFLVCTAVVGLGWAAPLDRAVDASVAAHRIARLTHFALSVTVLGNPSMVTLTVVIALFLAIAAGHSRLALPIVASPIAAFLTGNLMKDLLRHPRPPDPVIPDPASYGFPSGHAATAAATWLTLALLAMRFESRPAARKALLCCGAAVAVLVGWSRIYIGVHYFSDVIGGWLLGTLWSLLLVDGQDVVTGMSKG